MPIKSLVAAVASALTIGVLAPSAATAFTIDFEDPALDIFPLPKTIETMGFTLTTDALGSAITGDAFNVNDFGSMRLFVLGDGISRAYSGAAVRLERTDGAAFDISGFRASAYDTDAERLFAKAVQSDDVSKTFAYGLTAKPGDFELEFSSAIYVDFFLEDNAFGGFQIDDITGSESPMPAPVPLPAGAPLLLAALGGLAMLRRRSR